MLGLSPEALAQSDYEKLDRPADALVRDAFWSQSGLSLIFDENTPDLRSTAQVYFCPRKKSQDVSDCYQQYTTLQQIKRQEDGKIKYMRVIVRSAPFDRSWEMNDFSDDEFVQGCVNRDYERLTPLSKIEIEQLNKGLDKKSFYRLPDVRWDHGFEVAFKIPRLDGSVDYAVISEPGTRNLDKDGGRLRALFGREGNIREVAVQRFPLYKALNEATDDNFISRRHDVYLLEGIGFISVKEVHEFAKGTFIGTVKESGAWFNGRRIPEVSSEEAMKIRDGFQTKKYFDHVTLVTPTCF